MVDANTILPGSEKPNLPSRVNEQHGQMIRNRGALSVDDVIQQLELIQDIMQKVMKKDLHYGIIPSCSKPSLWKPGAEKLGLTFRLRGQHDITILAMGNGHNEYQVKCNLITSEGEIAGEGIGICSTMEGKYRYRTEVYDRTVPEAYWKSKDQSLLGGPDCFIKKQDKNWVVMRRIETDNPADNYNTCIKMAKKRAFIDAILTATAASDIFSSNNDDEEPEAGKKAASTGHGNQASNPAASESKADSGPQTIYGFAAAMERISQGDTFNGKLYQGSLIYIKNEKYQVTEEECSILKDMIRARGSSPNKPEEENEKAANRLS